MHENMEEQTRLLRTVRNLFIVALAVVLIAVLKMLSTLLLPLVLAILLTLVTLPLVIWLKERGVPKGIIIPIVVVITISVVFFIVNILTSTFSEVISQQVRLRDQFETKITLLLQLLSDRFNLNWNLDFSPIAYMIERIDLSKTIKGLAASVGSFGSSFFLFTLYYIFLLIGVSDYKTYLHYVVEDNVRLLESFETLQKSVATYISIKTVISLITALNAYLICKFFGVNFAIFWAFITFFLNFIPNIGSIISSLCIMFIAFIQFDTYSRFLVVSLLVTMNQMVIGNFIDPIVMGSRLRLNAVTVIFGLVFWGYIWDIPGMLLSVPLMVIIKLVLEQSESLGILARVMGYAAKEPKKRRFSFRRKKQKEGDEK